MGNIAMGDLKLNSARRDGTVVRLTDPVLLLVAFDGANERRI